MFLSVRNSFGVTRTVDTISVRIVSINAVQLHEKRVMKFSKLQSRPVLCILQQQHEKPWFP